MRHGIGIVGRNGEGHADRFEAMGKTEPRRVLVGEQDGEAALAATAIFLPSGVTRRRHDGAPGRSLDALEDINIWSLEHMAQRRETNHDHAYGNDKFRSQPHLWRKPRMAESAE